MDRKIGFIGCGNMAQAMIAGVIGANVISKEDLIVSNPSQGKLIKMKEKYNMQVANSNIEVAKFSDIIILAVKPYKYAEVIEEIKNEITEDKIIITIAAGVTIESVESHFTNKTKVVRTMPNTPALVGEAMTAVCFNKNISENEKSIVQVIFSSFGKMEIIEEKLMDMIPSISGSSPAYVYMFIEALADGAVARGLQRDKAYEMAAQSVLGAAKMVLETGKHPAQLKDEVCSPGGTTIQAVYALEKNNFRASVISAMESCTEKAMELSKKN